MGKRTIRINENDIRKMVAECIKRTLMEIDSPLFGWDTNNYTDKISKKDYDIIHCQYKQYEKEENAKGNNYPNLGGFESWRIKKGSSPEGRKLKFPHLPVE